MANENIFNKFYFTEEQKGILKELFNENLPIRHVVIDDFLEQDLAKMLMDHFPSLAAMKTHYKGINEKKSEDSDFSKHHASFSTLHQQLSSPLILDWLSQLTDIDELHSIDDRLGYGLHQGGNNSFLDIHIDYNIHPLKKQSRRLNLILFFNASWETDWGGHLELWDKDVKNCIQSIAPVFNRCVIFECSNISYHGYSRIHVPEQITRKSYYQYYFTPPGKDISFHDTIFKSRPKESFAKKIATPVKEFAKNTVKRMLMKLGWKKFLE